MAAARVFKVEFRIAVAQRILNGESVSDPEGAQIAGNLDSVRRALEAIIRCGFFTIRTSPAALSIYLSIDSFFGPPVSEIDLPTSLKASNSDFGISFNLTSQENVDAGGSSDLLIFSTTVSNSS